MASRIQRSWCPPRRLTTPQPFFQVQGHHQRGWCLSLPFPFPSLWRVPSSTPLEGLQDPKPPRIPTPQTTSLLQVQITKLHLSMQSMTCSFGSKSSSCVSVLFTRNWKIVSSAVAATATGSSVARRYYFFADWTPCEKAKNKRSFQRAAANMSLSWLTIVMTYPVVVSISCITDCNAEFASLSSIIAPEISNGRMSGNSLWAALGRSRRKFLLV